jgi:hypothetical protein
VIEDVFRAPRGRSGRTGKAQPVPSPLVEE